MRMRRLIWLARSLVILFAAFMSLFARDAVPTKFAPMEIAGLLIHLGPVFLLIGILLATWNHPRLAGSLYLILAAAFTIFFKTYRSAPTFLTISVPVFLAGLLFIGLSFVRSGAEPGREQ